MEFLIIVFIIVSIFSSITRQIKKSIKKESSFDPWSFNSDSAENVLQNPKVKTEEETGVRESFIKEEKSELDLTVRQEDFQEDDSSSRNLNDSTSPSYEEVIEQIKPSFLQEEEQKKEDISLQIAVDFESELKSLLIAKKLPLGIISLEILGPPRAIKPARGRSFGRFIIF